MKPSAEERTLPLPMTWCVVFTVPGAPVPKGRPRLGKGGHVYTPKATRVYEQTVRTYALQAMTQRELAPTGGPVKVEIYLPRPGAYDLDNVAKALLDAMNGFVYLDDRQVDWLIVARDSAAALTTVVVSELP